MNVESLNKQFIEALKTKIPQKTNLAKSIMEELFIGKEAVYRRLRGDVVFTFPEIVSLSRRYGVSIDALAGNLSPNSILFELKPTNVSSDLKDIDYGLFKQFADIINSIKDDETSEIAYSSNMYPQLIYTKYYHLSKLHTLKWLYQQEYLNKHNEPYHLIDYPDDLQELKVEAYNKLKYLHESTYIWDAELFKSIVNDIKYFESVNLITRKEDFEAFKEELHLLLNDLEQLAMTGRFDTGNKVNIYVSNINIDATYCYIKSKTFNASMIGVFSMNFISSLEERTLEKMQQWALAQKKVSTLISESGEMQRTRFFKRQREIIGAL